MRFFALALAALLLTAPTVAADHVLGGEPNCPQDSGGLVGLVLGFVGDVECAAWDFVDDGAHLAVCFLLGGPEC